MTEPMKENNAQSTDLPEDRFVRIATTYYKIVMRPNATGELVE